MIAFGLFVTYAMDTLQHETISQREKIDIEKNKILEDLKLIEVMDNPLRIDVMNLGKDTIRIKKLFIDNIVDYNFLIDGVRSNEIVKGKVVQITPILSGKSISIITENHKSYNFRW